MLGRAAITIIFAVVQPISHPIQFDETGGDPGDSTSTLPEFLDRLERAHDLLFHPGHLSFEAIFADRENLLFHFIEEVVDLILFFEGTPDAFGAGGDDLPEDVFLANDLKVVSNVRRRGHEGEKAGDERRAADGVEHISIAQNLREGDQVDPLRRIPEFDQMSVDRLVRGNVEIRLVNFLDAFRDGFTRRDEHGTEHALLCFHAVGERPTNILWKSC